MIDLSPRRATRASLIVAVALCLGLGCESCGAVRAWLTAPAGQTGTTETTDAGTTEPDEPAPATGGQTNGDALVSSALSIAGSINPLAGFAVLALGRLGLGLLAKK